MRVHLKLFFKWGIEFDKDNPYSVEEHGNRKVEYAEKKEIQDGIMKKYHPKEYEELLEAERTAASGSVEQIESEQNEPEQSNRASRRSEDKKSGGGIRTAPPSSRHEAADTTAPAETGMEESNGQT